MLLTPSKSGSLFVFIDESGDLAFGAKSSRHFVLSGVITYRPHKVTRPLARLKYEFMSRGLEDQCTFHATENSKGTRARIMDRIKDAKQHFQVQTVFVQKQELPSGNMTEVQLFGLAGKSLCLGVLSQIKDNVKTVVFVFDCVLTGNKKKAFIQGLKQALKSAHVYKEVRVQLIIHPVKEELNGQVADYYSWAYFRALESQDHAHIPTLTAATTNWSSTEVDYSGV